MKLSDNDILSAKKEGKIKIRPFRKKNLHPSSYEIHLGKAVMYYAIMSDVERVIDHTRPVDEFMESAVISETFGAFVPPGGVILAVSEETVSLDESLVATLGATRHIESLGLSVRSVHEAIEPGMSSKVQLYIKNNTNFSVKIFPGMPIARISFEELKSPSGLIGKSSGIACAQASEIHKHLPF